MFGITVTKENEVLKVGAPYDKAFVRRVKQIGGKWENPYWTVPAKRENNLRNLLKDIYGSDGSDEPTASIQIDMDAYWKDAKIEDLLRIGPIEVLVKRDRDYAPRVHENAAVVAGELCTYGGSRNNPRITWKDGTVIECDGIPASVAVDYAERYPAITIVSSEISASPTPKDRAADDLLLLLETVPATLQVSPDEGREIFAQLQRIHRALST